MNAPAPRPSPAALLAPLDAARAAFLASLPLRTAFGRKLLADRHTRVAFAGCLAIVLALATTCVAPLWVLALGPVLLGIPHLVADARYLVVRPRLHVQPRFWLAIALPTALTWVHPSASVGAGAIVGAAVVARGVTPAKRLAAVSLALAFLLAALASGRRGDIVFAHLHNLVAIGLWWSWAPRQRASRWVVLVAFAAATAFLLLGPALALLHLAHGHVAAGSGLDLGEQVALLSPVAHPLLGTRMVLVFAFAQSVHYAVWLRLIPEEARERRGVRGFASSYRALVVELGPLVVGAACLMAIALAGWALVDLVRARSGYLRLALVHGHLELAVVALWLLEGRPASVPSGASGVTTST